MCHWGYTWWYWRKNKRDFFLIHITFPGQPQLCVRILWKSTLMDPRLHLNIAELVAGGRENIESYTLAPKALPGNDLSLCSQFIWQRKSIMWLCMISPGWRCVVFHQERLLCGWKVLQLTDSPLFCHHISIFSSWEEVYNPLSEILGARCILELRIFHILCSHY